MPDKVAVFIDYENVHRTGHGLFARLGELLYQTVVNPLLLSELIVAKRKLPCILSEVSVFRGRPVPAFQPKPASANDIQAAAWESDARVTVTRRDLKYDRNDRNDRPDRPDRPDDGTFLAREKGIDVALAVALTEGSLDQRFDVAIVFSGDTDLLPALELVFTRQLAHLEIATWTGQKPLWFPEFLRQTPARKLPYCHFLNEEDFIACRDFSVDLD